MQIVITHHNADLDALASVVAASKLYSGAIGIRGRSISLAVRRYLALHKDKFPLLWYHEIEPSMVERVIVVDVRDRRRLSEYEAILDNAQKIIVYDHHPVTHHDIDADEVYVEPVGACITLLCEQLRDKKIPIEPAEATLMLLGLYADTGQLSYASTTPRDIDIAAYLLRSGANLKIVQRYLEQEFSDAQRRLLITLLASNKDVTIDGVDIGITCAECDEYVSGASEVVGRLLQFGGYDAVVALVAFNDKNQVQVIARSQVPYVDVGAIMRRLGGGGHQGAGAVMLKRIDLEPAYKKVLQALQQEPLKPTRVRDLMSSPVQFVDHRTTLEDVRDLLAHWNVTGVPIMREGKLSGIISRRDLPGAEENDKWSLPVSAYMTHKVFMVSPAMPLEEALEMMTQYDVGRLPVEEDGRLVGIVSRSDIIRCLYQKD